MADAEAAVGINALGEFDPEFVFLPYFARISLVGELDFLPLSAPVLPQDRLAKREPHSRMGLLTLQIVAFRCVPGRQHVIGEEGSLTPGGRQGDMETDLAFVAQDLHPGESVRV